jgi:hypothetical protein
MRFTSHPTTTTTTTTLHISTQQANGMRRMQPFNITLPRDAHKRSIFAKRLFTFFLQYAGSSY